jgi:hypothetical protein
MSEKSVWNFRGAGPDDAEAFAKWVENNSQIESADFTAASKQNNPSVLCFVVEKDGVAVAFAPVYFSLALAHLAFNPKADGRDKLEAMQRLLNGTVAFAVQFGIREITTLSKEDYPVAKWAVKHGFDLESRQLLKFDINKVLIKAKEESTCAVPAEA